MNFRRALLPMAAALLAGVIAAHSANITLFSSTLGDVVLPFSAPTQSAPGTIDNMTIGSGTPRNGTFLALVASSVTNNSPTPINQGAPNAQTVSATLTAANLQTGIITVLQGAGAASVLTLPLATAMDTALPNSVAGSAFDFSVINISTTAAESASIATATGWTLVGDMDIQANSAATTKSAGHFRARKTGTGAWVLYRLS